MKLGNLSVAVCRNKTEENPCQFCCFDFNSRSEINGCTNERFNACMAEERKGEYRVFFRLLGDK